MSQLTDTLFLLYSYQSDDTARMTRVITERRKATWLNVLGDLAKTHGCSQFPKSVKGSDARELERMSQEDAESITRTYNRELRNQIERIYKANPRANRNAYYRQLEAWAKKRNSWKSLQIGLYSDSTARYYAKSRFWAENGLQDGRFVFRGPPPTCERCVKLFAAGVVDGAFVRSHKTPIHHNCPHEWERIGAQKIACSELWLG